MLPIANTRPINRRTGTAASTRNTVRDSGAPSQMATLTAVPQITDSMNAARMCLGVISAR